MKYSLHALHKLELYGLAREKVTDACESPLHNFYDKKEASKIKIIEMENILFALVIDPATDKVITIYRTDRTTVENRRKAERWT